MSLKMFAIVIFLICFAGSIFLLTLLIGNKLDTDDSQSPQVATQPQQIVVQQPAPKVEVQVQRPVPQLQIPVRRPIPTLFQLSPMKPIFETTRCREFFDGSIHCYTY